MKLPENLAEVYRKETNREPLQVARAIYDIQGHLGCTYVAADTESLTLFSKPSGGTDTTVLLNWKDVHQASARADGAFAFLELSTNEGPFVLRFTGWDRAVLDSMVALWIQPRSTSDSPTNPAGPTADQRIRASAIPSSVSPLVAFCAGIHAMIECDATIDPAELRFLASRVPDAETVARGHDFLKQAGVVGVCACLGAALNEAQKRCLLANLISVAMLDGRVRTAESALLVQFQTSLQMSDADYQAIFDVLMTRNDLTVFPTTDVAAAHLPDLDGLTPLVVFCASMLAMMEADGQVTPDEMEFLALAVPYPNDIRLGEDVLHAFGLDHLLARLPVVLNAAQQRCLMANLISLVMVDGLIRTAERERLERFQEALKFPASDYAALYQVLLEKDNLSVFAEG